MLTPGEPAPWFTARASVNPKYQFDTVAGRYVVLCFFSYTDAPEGRRVLAEINQNQQHFDLENFLFLGVSSDPSDEQTGRLTQDGRGSSIFGISTWRSVVCSGSCRQVTPVTSGRRLFWISRCERWRCFRLAVMSKAMWQLCCGI